MIARTESRHGVSINTTFLRRCIRTLELAFEQLGQVRQGETTYDVFRAACVKEFELVLEQSGKLLRKRLAAFFASHRQADRLVFKDLFRHAARHGLIDTSAVERWLRYRDTRNYTAHDYGESLAEGVVELLPGFIADATQLVEVIEESDDD